MAPSACQLLLQNFTPLSPTLSPRVCLLSESVARQNLEQYAGISPPYSRRTAIPEMRHVQINYCIRRMPIQVSRRITATREAVSKWSCKSGGQTNKHYIFTLAAIDAPGLSFCSMGAGKISHYQFAIGQVPRLQIKKNADRITWCARSLTPTQAHTGRNAHKAHNPITARERRTDRREKQEIHYAHIRAGHVIN
jgi:hypothetical protein